MNLDFRRCGGFCFALICSGTLFVSGAYAGDNDLSGDPGGTLDGQSIEIELKSQHGIGGGGSAPGSCY